MRFQWLFVCYPFDPKYRKLSFIPKANSPLPWFVWIVRITVLVRALFLATQVIGFVQGKGEEEMEEQWGQRSYK